jgi:receptor protein-tyrosine kinase
MSEDHLNSVANKSTNLEQLVPVLRRRWRLLVLCVVLVAAAAIGFSVLQRKEYTASTSLLFRNDNFAQELFGASYTTPAAPAQEQATNIDLVSMPIVAARTAAALHINPALVRSETSVSEVGQSNIAQVSVTDPDPGRAARIANTYADQFVLFRQQSDRAEIAGAQALVQNKLAALPLPLRGGSVGQALQNRANQLGVLAALQTGNAEVVQPAAVPRSPSSPQTRRNGLLGLLLGLLLGVGLVFVSERLDRRIRDPSEFEAACGVPLLGVIAESVDYQRAGVDPLSPARAEAFALIRARLRYFNVDRELRTLLISSAIPGEGKSTIALNVAIAEAAAGRSNVILVEADLRRPVLARRLELAARPGLAEILSGNAALDAAMHAVPIPTRTHENGDSPFLTVVTAGAVPPNPVELVESRAMTDLLTALSERFDLIVIDSPPTSIVSDAIPLMRRVSGVVLVTRVGRTTRDAARNLRQQLDKLGAPVLGVIANGLAAKGHGDYGYTYGYGDYSNGDGYVAEDSSGQTASVGARW